MRVELDCPLKDVREFSESNFLRPLTWVCALLCVVVVAIGGCGRSEEHADLKQELAQLTKDVRGRVEPLPQVKPYEPVPYTAEGQIDPFRPERIDVAAAGRRAGASKLAPDSNRPKEPLESFPIDAIKMLGTIRQAQETFALVKAGPNVYRVKKGNYLGQNFGVVTDIDEGAINLKELVQDSGGEWVERQSILPLGDLSEPQRVVPLDLEHLVPVLFAT